MWHQCCDPKTSLITPGMHLGPKSKNVQLERRNVLFLPFMFYCLTVHILGHTSHFYQTRCYGMWRQPRPADDIWVAMKKVSKWEDHKFGAVLQHLT